MIEARIDGAALGRQMLAEIRAGEQAVSSAMRELGSEVKEGWRIEIRTASLGERLARTVRSDVYPKGRPSINAAALVYTRAPEIVSAHAEGEVIRSADGFWLAIPTKAAGRSTRRGRITPGEWERRTGLRLRFVYRSGRSALLVADGVRISKAGRAVLSRAKRRNDGTRKGEATAVIFVLVPQVRLRKRLDFDRHVGRARQRIGERIVDRWVADRTGISA